MRPAWWPTSFETRCALLRMRNREPNGRPSATTPSFSGRRPADQECVVDRHAESRDQPVGFGGHADDGDHLAIFRFRHALRTRARGVRMDAVAASVRDRYRNVEHFLDLGIERPGCHHLLDAVPGTAEGFWIMRQRPPEIVDEVRLPRLPDVSEYGARFGREFLVGKQFYRRHGFTRGCCSL